jgi:hypothetical protein
VGRSGISRWSATATAAEVGGVRMNSSRR